MRAYSPAFLCIVIILSCNSLLYCQNHQVAIGDVNGDGKPDVVVALPNTIGVFLNTGGALGPGAFLAAPGLQTISLADINGDGHLDIVLVATDSNSNPHLQVMLGDGKGNFAAPAEIATSPGGPISNAVVADFNGDGHLDIAFGINVGTPHVAIIFGDGHGGFSAPGNIPIADDTTNVFDLVLLDANKDSKPDLIANTAHVVTGFLHESFLLLNDGTANFSVSFLCNADFVADTSGWATTTADFDGDGFLDFLFGLDSPLFIIFGDGHGGALSTSPEFSAFVTPEGFAADVDGNQTIDLVSPRLGSYFPGNGHGGFGDPISLGFPQGTTLIAVADMNGDGKPDFLLLSGSNVSVVLNSLAPPASISASTALQLSLSAATTSVGLPVTLSASVLSYGGTPVGTVTFFDGAQSLGSAAVNPYGVAAISTSFSTAGLHNNLTASFNGTLAANTFFLNSSTASDPRSISVNTSQPTGPVPSLVLVAFPNPARLHNPVHVSAQVTVLGNPTGSIFFTADGNVLGVAPLLGVGTGLNVSFPSLGPHNIQAIYGGDATFPQATSAVLVENIQSSVPADFGLDASPQSATVKAGQSAIFNLTINPVGDLASTVGFSCSGLPAAASCSFSPATLTPGINPISTTLTLTTTAPSAAGVFPLRGPGPLLWAFTLASCFSALLVVLLRDRRGAARRVALVWAAIVFASLLGSCGGGNGGTTGGGSNGTPPGTSSVTVTATSATSHTTALTITVTP